jgi:hypothetical protein
VRGGRTRGGIFQRQVRRRDVAQSRSIRRWGLLGPHGERGRLGVARHRMRLGWLGERDGGERLGTVMVGVGLAVGRRKGAQRCGKEAVVVVGWSGHRRYPSRLLWRSSRKIVWTERRGLRASPGEDLIIEGCAPHLLRMLLTSLCNHNCSTAIFAGDVGKVQRVFHVEVQGVAAVRPHLPQRYSVREAR